MSACTAFSIASFTAICTGSFWVIPTSDSRSFSVSTYLKILPFKVVESIVLSTNKSYLVIKKDNSQTPISEEELNKIEEKIKYQN